jgi:hypothetical protein
MPAVKTSVADFNERENRHILSGRWSPTRLIVSGIIALRQQKQDQKQGQRAGAPALHEQGRQVKTSVADIKERNNRHILSGRWSPTRLIVSGIIALRR